MAKKRKCDQWPDLCELVKNDDGLPVNAYGPWTEEKLRFWHRYVDITTSSMVGHPRWQAGLVYVDLFTGSGVCKIDETGKRLPGSPLIAACAEKPFREIRLCELDHDRADACEKRVRQFAPNSDVKLFKGDCNQKIDEITTGIPQGALTLAFIDPEGLDVEFETIRILASRCRADLLILVADAIDFVRNVSMYITQAESRRTDSSDPIRIGVTSGKRWVMSTARKHGIFSPISI